MTKREQEQLQRLLDKKATEEAADKDFYTAVRKRRHDVLRVLGVDEGACDIVRQKADDVGITMAQLADVVQRIPPDWIHKIIIQKREQG